MKKNLAWVVTVCLLVILTWGSGWGFGWTGAKTDDSTFYTQRIQEIYDSVRAEPDYFYYNTSFFLKLSLTDTGAYVPLHHLVRSFPYYVTRGRYRMKIYTIPPDSSWRIGFYTGPLPSDSAK